MKEKKQRSKISWNYLFKILGEALDIVGQNVWTTPLSMYNGTNCTVIAPSPLDCNFWNFANPLISIPQVRYVPTWIFKIIVCIENLQRDISKVLEVWKFTEVTKLFAKIKKIKKYFPGSFYVFASFKEKFSQILKNFFSSEQ